ncbi:methylated-DNA-[protein]-cysteine S-methyltransferase [Cupriavidus metallidurans]|jgi:methylated-DNA-[protein]-cysteine S-methyltransferase|uniref:Methylated-DNA (Protein)-cysteine S-methyltransferase n=1 Tax=Cupriavidus metallidurans (strain ATCC 43123 / DSM 2839 / NBRC 102507 / CH34) TaxID=266264 RepID=Q1LR20_CUPMC|nr:MULTISPECIES: methylated-DNA--[protein]-cysteine S-methyltransferase [Cupriavidus]HBD38717.1 methylated-DNA--[protein]-cysteine S-methyltransferase [Cupriavidus sp.]ABF07406.1 Methylated-DNA (protein)-cysteine S-methyltransferase [Cupriavidus metallidurans CH34]AVA32655.1 methylated-DNA--[protein]-cysteine S-methyltransferase [Cupriavidus metallidurans]EKZ99256.1 Methylated-DNA (protein)-cysteine S-methyltransferase [Cupriavidus sp. HMR-1]KWW36160.1 Methylated-DNA--protein-cysteine methyltr
MQHHFDAVLPAPFGKVGVRVDGTQVHEIVYLPDSFAEVPPTSALTKRVAEQLDAYYANADTVFDLPLARRGTDFQRKVWAAISAVPRGGLTTYGTIAKSLQSMPRAVGQACGQNWFPIVVPCHRVVAANGLGGFAHHGEEGFHLGVKRWLLRHEGAMLL